ncbi:MAG: SURF1 family cytochrome oxidase biogenesis protein [Vogesella sp.]|uniref:SURF1 family cytochrome oxidase biogenesis protein n=1 Tax=Vogesella sp. TaxID=1904252 RepID=UPI00391C8051
MPLSGLITRTWHLLAWLAVILLLWAVWQWQQGMQASSQLAMYARAANLPPQALAEVELGAHPQGQRVWLTLREGGKTVRLANARLQGQDGVREWQPVQLLDGSWVVIDRGWLARPAPLLQLPLPAGRLTGRWVGRPSQPEGMRIRVGLSGEVDALDWAALARQLPGPLRDGLVVLDPALRPYASWPVTPALNPGRHYRQAAWSLAAALLSLLLWWGWPRHHR